MRPKRSNDPVKAAHELFLEIIGEAPPQPLRTNLHIRMSMRRFTRLTNAFSRKRDNLRAALALHFAV